MLNIFTRRLLGCLICLLFSYLCAGNNFPAFKLKSFNTLNGLPSNDVQKIYQDKSGYIWIASKNGLYQYDGYIVNVYKSNLYNPSLLSNNNIFCLEEDCSQRLWIGTYKGLNMMEKRTKKIVRIDRPEFINNSISKILVTKDNRLLLGTDQGLYQYIYEKDSCILFGRNNTGGVLPETSIKSIFEDSYGHIWIGTWNDGLYRYDPETGKYYSYPKMNTINSAHVIFEDSRKRIWVGTWGEGLQLLNNPYDMDNVNCTTFKRSNDDHNSLLSNIIYDISEDLNTKTLWVGTPNGLSVLADDRKGYFLNNYFEGTDQSASIHEVNSIVRDNQGMMWFGMLRGGVNMVVTRKPYFNSYKLENIKHDFNTNSVSSILVDDENKMWLSIGNDGVVVYDKETGNYEKSSDVVRSLPGGKLPSVLTMTQLKNGQIWFGTYNVGLFIYDKYGKSNDKIKQYTSKSTPWLSGWKVYVIHEDSQSRIWIGTDYGMTMLAPDYQYLRFDSLEYNGNRLRSAIIMDIKEGNENEIWAASNNSGIFRILGKGTQLSGYSLENYSPENGKLNSTNISCIYKDKKGRIWAGSEGGGLNVYDPKTNSFISVHSSWNLPGDAVFNIRSDEQGNLWMGTNSGLVKLHVQDDLKNATYRLYTTSDGLLDNSFNRSAIFQTKGHELLLGGHQGLNSFYPDQLSEEVYFMPPIYITDIKIYNRSWSDLESELRYEISPVSPEYAEKVRLDYKNNNFSIEFAALGYENPTQLNYAYKLEGFDDSWHYTNASRRFAYYNNLNPGIYKFLLKATNINGVWGDKVVTMQILVLPPPWKTWWAFLIYIVVTIAISITIFRTLSNRMKLRNALQLRELEQTKSTELNHAKLQFFTNITHELLTPLTIISAAVDELKIQEPQHTAHYQVMTNNINRLIRLLQQILEFRKAETGNLRLKVSRGDLAAFVTTSIESFRPLMKKKKIRVNVACDPAVFPAYFDPDKLDKILYNLFSNASKYGEEGGEVSVTLRTDASRNAVITVKDNGQGISKEAQKNLFKRFYEGDYRKFKTIGTGIGLSLTKDLVVLHGGEISVQSELGEGTAFIVVIPVTRDAYKEEEIDEVVSIPETQLPEIAVDVMDKEEEVLRDTPLTNTILLIEDNEDLLELMSKLLGAEYKVLTATNGKEGLDIMHTEDVDLVVSDIMMPVMDGVEFCKEVKNNFEICHVPVLLLTAKTGESDRVNAYESGADAFLNKPFNLSVLHARINNLLKARERTNKDFKKQLVFEAKELNYTTLDEEFLQKAIDCVHRNLDDPDYDQARFIEDMGTSRSTLFRKMKSLTGLSYVSFIRNVRLKAACQIMEEKKNVRVSELAYAVGFNDPRYFSTCFKKEFGMQPREYYERFVLNKKEEDELD